MFAQLGSIQFGGLQTFVNYGTSEEMAIADFALIGRKPKLMGGGIGLVTLDLSIFLHVEFTPDSVEVEIGKIKTALENFEILPLLWGNGETGGNWVIKSMQVEYTNLDARGNVYEARVNVSLLESVVDNAALQEQQAAANKAFAIGNKQPATKSKRKNAQSCPSQIAALVQEIEQFGAVVNQIVAIYTGDQKQAAQVSQACGVITDDANQIDNAVTINPQSCVYKNATLGNSAGSVVASAATLSGDIVDNAKAVNGVEVGGDVASGTRITAENTGLQAAIKRLVAAAQPVVKKAIVQ